MKHGLTVAIILLLGSSASADCLDDYNAAVHSAQASANKKKDFTEEVVTGMGPAAVSVTGVGGAMISAYYTGTAATVAAHAVAGLPLLSTVGAMGFSSYLNSQVKDIEVAQMILMQAQMGDGLELRSLYEGIAQENSKLTLNELTQTIIELNSSRALCTPAPMTYSQLHEYFVRVGK